MWLMLIMDLFRGFENVRISGAPYSFRMHLSFDNNARQQLQQQQFQMQFMGISMNYRVVTTKMWQMFVGKKARAFIQTPHHTYMQRP